MLVTVKRDIPMLAVCAALLLHTACVEDGESSDPSMFSTGDFTVTTTIVDDRCLDGGLNPLFMPNGVNTPWAWPYPVQLHAPGDLPVSYGIRLRDPFGEMSITAEKNGELGQTLDAAETSILLGEDQFGQCTVDMSATVELSIADANRASGVVNVLLRDPRGDDRCPVDMPAECQVMLNFEAARTGGT